MFNSHQTHHFWNMIEVINDIGNKITYPESIQKMNDIVDEIIAKKNNEKIWILEYDDVYTVGGSGSKNDVLDKSIPCFETNRGGKVTYHGNGQIVIYFMLDIRKRFNSDVHNYVKFLENLIIHMLSIYNIKAEIKDNIIGIFVQNKKIASIGIRIRNGISMHGISININPDLTKFNGIIPCGIKEFGVCSIVDFGKNANISEFITKTNIIQYLKEILC